MRESREPPCDLRLADTGRPDHQDVLWCHFVSDIRRQTLTTKTIAQGDRHGTFRLGLPDDVLIELGDDLARRQGADGGRGALGKRDGHKRVLG